MEFRHKMNVFPNICLPNFFTNMSNQLFKNIEYIKLILIYQVG